MYYKDKTWYQIFADLFFAIRNMSRTKRKLDTGLIYGNLLASYCGVGDSLSMKSHPTFILLLQCEGSDRQSINLIDISIKKKCLQVNF
jgi:hypothetical protein